MGRLQDLLDKQGERLDRLTGGRVRATLSALDDGRRALLELLQMPVTSARAAMLRLLLARAELGVSQMRQRVEPIMDESDRLVTEAARVDLIDIIRAADPRAGVPVSITDRLDRGLLLHRYSLTRYSAQVIEAIQRQIVAGVAAGLDQAEIARRVAAAAGSVVANHRGRAELIVRMELGRAYNDSYLESLRELEALDPNPDDPLLKRIDEYIDARNHPFSRVANQMSVPLDAPFRVPVSRVQDAASQMRRSAGGVLWPVVGNAYEGHNLPAHYNDRGRIVAWRKSWGT